MAKDEQYGKLENNVGQAVVDFVDLYGGAVSACAHEHGWWEDPKLHQPIDRNMGEMIALMHSELSEALESYRDGEPELWYKHNYGPDFMHGPDVYSPPDSGHSKQSEFNGKPGKPEGLASEFADVIIRILDTCATLDIPLAEALLRKHEYNLTRPYRHGGKLA